MKTYRVTLTITGIVKIERGGTVKQAEELAVRGPFGTSGCGPDGSYRFTPDCRGREVYVEAKAVEVKEKP